MVIRGVAWSGAAPIAGVDVSIGGGHGSRLASSATASATAGNGGSCSPGSTSRARPPLRARATDLAGRTQPEHPAWNRLGYGGNAIQAVTIHVGTPPQSA